MIPTGDIAFHFSRIKGLSSVFSGPINFTTFNSYGGGDNFFYPYLTLFLLNMIKAVGWTILLTAYVWYPMLQQVLHQKINRPFRTNLQERALNISDSLI
ncbi:hypothetical protein EfmAA242_31230 (plasmid) [Enterococcus faecium]|nr:hypothetical protein EfmAA242_31230 [Enterococcus faecium]